MAKFSRLGPVWRKPRPKPWKQLKNCARWANERQWIEEFDPEFSTALEIVDETGVSFYLVTEQTIDPYNNPEFIKLEQS